MLRSRLTRNPPASYVQFQSFGAQLAGHGYHVQQNEGLEMSATLTSADVKRLGRSAGFDLAGIAAAAPLDDHERYVAWLERGFHGTMDYLERGAEPRCDPRALLPEARSVVVCALSYLTPHPFSVEQGESDRPIISRYAWGRDYHRVVRKRLRRLLQLIERQSDRPIRARICVDSAPLLERAYAARAGLGWIGKNNCLINPRFGSFLFLGELLIDLELEADRPVRDDCGQCNLCLEGCPSGALVEPRLLDARRCISYATIEHRGADVDEAAGARRGTRVFGCDACQEVCPWNEKAQGRLSTIVRELLPSPSLIGPSFDEIVFDDEAGFRDFFAGTVVRRLGWRGWRRNMKAALRNAVAAVPAGRRRLRLRSLLERLERDGPSE